MAAPDDDEVPKLPRGRGLKLSTSEIFRILLTGGMLVAIIVLAKPCGSAVSNFVMRFDNGSAQERQQQEMPKPGNVDEPVAHPQLQEPQYEHLKPGMSEQEVKAAVERAEAKAKAGSAAGSGTAAGSGMAAGSAAAAGSGSGSGSK